MRAVSQDEVTLVADVMQLHLYKLLRSFESCDQHCLVRYEITAAQSYTLLALPASSDTSMNELSRTMGLANSTMTRMVDNLVKKDLVHRWTDEQNRRVVRVALTVRGKELRRELYEARRELQRQILAELRKEDQPSILDALGKLDAAVEKAMRECHDE